MRIALLLVAVLVASPRHTAAEPIVEMEFLNSEFSFGSNADQWGWDLSSFWAAGFDNSWDVWNSGYQAVAGPLDHQLDTTDGAGDVVGTEYVYLGGRFEIFFVLEDGEGATRKGSFVADIERLTVQAGAVPGSNVELFYVLGAGVFDGVIADTLGISRRTSGGEAHAQLMLTDGDDPSLRTPTHQASDGVNDITLSVPEPTLLALVATGLAIVGRRRQRIPR